MTVTTMIRERWRLAGAIAVVVTLSACDSGRLTTEAAQEILRADLDDPGIPIEVNGVAQADGSIKAIADTSVFDFNENLQMAFRRYDSGWKWESTTAPGRLPEPSSSSITTFRTLARLQRSREWGEPLIPSYRLTAEVMHALAGNLSRRQEDDLSDDTWKVRYDLSLSILRSVPPPNPARSERLLPLFDPPTDAWGGRIKWTLANNTRSARISSDGPDRLAGTTDDLICELTGRLAWDSLYEKRMWDYLEHWQFPEGVGLALSDYLPPTRPNNTADAVIHVK
jgi:hypothetical protein